LGDDRGWAVLRAAVERARGALGDRLVAAYAVGSLTHGGFAADVSDVDGVLIVDRCDAGVAAGIASVVVDTRDALADDLAERLSLFWGDWPTFGAPPESARLPPIVRLDLLDNGVALVGEPPPPGLPRPTCDDLVRETAAFAAQWLERDGIPSRPELLDAGRRRTTKMVLFPVRFLATVRAGLSGSNDEAVAWYVGDNGPHARLAGAALRWRAEPIDDPALLDDLPALYAEALDAVRRHPAVPDDLRARLARLVPR
jgi:hypothetical protein